MLAELAGVESLQEALRGFDTTETALAGFDEREVLAAHQRIEAKLGDGPPAEDLTALAGALVRAPDRSASAQPGVFYELGPHRLLCGDARDLEAVRRLIGVAEPAMLWTDPPYGVNYSAEGSRGAASSRRPGGRRDRPLGSIAGDDLEPEAHAGLVTAALCNAAAVLAPGSAVYVCCGTSTTTLYDAAFADAGLAKSSIVVWDKGRFAFGRRDYQSQYELVYYGWKRGARHRFFGGRAQSDIWPVPDRRRRRLRTPDAEAGRPRRAGDPQQLGGGRYRTRPLRRLGLVVDRRRAGRAARLPARARSLYVDVIVGRWEAFTGLRARAVSDGGSGGDA